MNQEPYRIQPQGYFDADQVSDFRAQIKAAIQAQEPLVILDCQDVIQIDSSGLGELILAYKSLQQVDSKFILCSINDQVKTLLNLTDMHHVFEVW